MKTLALWCVRWRFFVLGGWVVVLLALGGAVVGLGSAFTDSVTLPNSESSTAYSLLAQQSQSAADTTSGNIVWRTNGTSVTAPQVQKDAATVLADVAKVPGVLAVNSPYTAAGQAQLNANANTAYATVTLAKNADADAVVAVAKHLQSSTVDVQAGGQAFTKQPGGGATEGLGILIALGILLLMFRSLWAAVLPIITGVVGVGVSLLAVIVGSHLFDLSATSLTMGALIGLGVGIDYALFVVNRFRKTAAAGVPVADAVATAVNTSGRAVVFAALTVIVALVGMLVVNIGLLTGMAMVGAFTVLITMAAAITLLPALLAILGRRVLSRRQRQALTIDRVSALRAALGRAVPSSRRRQTPTVSDPVGVEHRRAGRWAAVLQRAPLRMGAAALLLIVVLAAPVLAMRVGDADASSDPAGSTTHTYNDVMTNAFGPGFNAQLVLVATTPDAQSAAAFATLVAHLPSVPGVASVAAAPIQVGQPLAVATLIPTTTAQAAQTTDLVHTLRESTVPTAAAGNNLHIYVGGTTATSIDLSQAVSSKLLLYLVVIAALGFLLLAVAFRSILVPLIGAITNLATICVGLGAVTAIFQFGWGSQLLGVGSSAPVMYLVPTLIVGIMFGLSMDYQVFLASRVHEEWTHTGDNRRAVQVGVNETSTVIAAAATIMLAVFASFGFSGQRIVSEIGIGLAIAVVVDAFVVRLTLIPAIMNMLGRHNWSYPRWAERITPRLSIEGESDLPRTDDREAAAAAI